MAEETLQSALLGKIAAYTEILQKDPKSTIFVSLGEAYRKLGHLDDARQIIEEGLAIHLDFSPAYVVLARTLCQQSEYEASDVAFAKAIELDGNSLAGLVGYARLAALIENVEKARALLFKARSLSPADPVINKFLNSLPPAQKEPENLSSEPAEVSAPLISATLADLYLKQSLPDKALEILRELMRNDPNNLELRRRIREAELMLDGDLEQATAEVHVADNNEESTTADSEELTPLVDVESVDELKSADVEIEDEPLMHESVVMQPGLSTVDVEPDSDMSPLEIMNQWLENIQKRRTNV